MKDMKNIFILYNYDSEKLLINYEKKSLSNKQRSNLLNFFLLFLTNHNLFFTITINNFSDTDDNKIKFKKN